MMVTNRVVRKSRYSYPVIIEQDEHGFFVSCPALQGCFSQGKSYEEARKNIEEAIILHIEARRAVGEAIPKPHDISLSTIEVRA